MTTDYTKYKYTDYLEDQFFITSMNSPTKESERFWSNLVENEKIDIDEFISANRMLDAIRKNKKDIPQQRIDQLWERIDTSRNKRQKKSRRIRLFASLAVVASFLFLVTLNISSFLKKEEAPQIVQEEVNYEQFQTINRQNTTEIRIITGDSQVEIEENDAEVKYDSNGALVVNNKTVDATAGSQSTADKTEYSQLCVPYGKRAALTLSDGSRLWVNAGTTVIYPVTFSDNKREIYVEGEVYANVTKDDQKPFIVKTDHLEVCVRGTSFNLTAYKEDNFKRVVLVNGSVDIRQNGTETLLKPNQSFVCNDGINQVETVDVNIYTSWRDGIYIFQDEPIENILLQLARYYNVTLNLPKQSSGILCSGKLELKEELPRLLNGLSELASFNFSVKETNYRIQFTNK
jgi:hypothetical protein